MVKILREADPKPVPEVVKKHGISDETIYLWRKRFGSLEPGDVKRFRQLEQENAAQEDGRRPRPEIDVMKEIAEKNGGRVRAPAAGRLS